MRGTSLPVDVEVDVKFQRIRPLMPTSDVGDSDVVVRDFREHIQGIATPLSPHKRSTLSGGPGSVRALPPPVARPASLFATLTPGQSPTTPRWVTARG